MVPDISGTRDWFHGRQIFHGPGWGGGDCFRMIKCITFIVHFYCYYISSTSDHQALDPGGQGPLLYRVYYLKKKILKNHTVKNPPAMQEIWVLSLGWEEPLEESMAIHSSILARRIPMDRRPW